MRERGLSVPDDVSIVGFDNLPMSGMSEPGLSSIDVPKGRIGAMAIRLLDDMLAVKAPQPAAKVPIAGRLVKRGSVGRPVGPG